MINDRIVTVEVEDFLRQNSEYYIRALDFIKHEFSDLMISNDGQGRIYKVYSRGEKQNGEEIKDIWKIANKVYEYRNNDRETSIVDESGEIQIETRPANPKFLIRDLGDIIGITVVCILPQDIQIVLDFIDRQKSRHRFLEFEREKKQNRGYYAIHVIIGTRLPECYNLRCEVQIKTLLHDAWGALTHDLSYKPMGELDARMKRQIENLGDMLSTIDSQAELLNSLIKERWYRDQKRKELARRVLVLQLNYQCTPNQQVDANNHEEISTCQNIIEEIQSRQNILENCSYDSRDLLEVIERINTVSESNQFCFYSCRVLVYLASLRKQNDLNSMAIDTIERWVATLENPSELARAYLFKGLTCYCFGNLEEAYYQTRHALEHAIESEISELIAIVKGNIAYFLAEIGDSSIGKKLDAKEKAFRYIEEALSEVETQEQEARLADTHGFVKITFGETEDDIRDGLAQCLEATNTSPEPDLARAYFEIHERRAYARILEF